MPCCKRGKSQARRPSTFKRSSSKPRIEPRQETARGTTGFPAPPAPLWEAKLTSPRLQTTFSSEVTSNKMWEDREDNRSRTGAGQGLGVVQGWQEPEWIAFRWEGASRRISLQRSSIRSMHGLIEEIPDPGWSYRHPASLPPLSPLQTAFSQPARHHPSVVSPLGSNSGRDTNYVASPISPEPTNMDAPAAAAAAAAAAIRSRLSKKIPNGQFTVSSSASQQAQLRTDDLSQKPDLAERISPSREQATSSKPSRIPRRSPPPSQTQEPQASSSKTSTSHTPAQQPTAPQRRKAVRVPSHAEKPSPPAETTPRELRRPSSSKIPVRKTSPQEALSNKGKEIAKPVSSSSRRLPSFTIEPSSLPPRSSSRNKTSNPTASEKKVSGTPSRSQVMDVFERLFRGARGHGSGDTDSARSVEWACEQSRRIEKSGSGRL